MSIHDHFVGPMGGVLMSLIAFSIVFLVIVGLMLVMMATKMVAQAIDSRGKASGSSGSPASTVAGPGASAPTPAGAPGPSAVGIAPAEDLELVAVITASLCALMGRPVAVKSLRPLPASPVSHWRAMAKLENLEGFDG
ncbi:Oxaloacetate decarboxylase, gamma chain [Thermanaerovibrio velox DSM 12556]|uniref:Oxaloacetate decarboxylase, gamma chain n=1 Tax=Thermanaerovibrio velox DSM 12556 TaxID=926567 RepID=H0UPI4_9BACT|nr:OadG family protein [Thermanaerovibrio velox]EHM10615.1 Oxaloacetate decarboxylase, gamma chain [Thermanaerovibrio velox DSM 12556]